MRQLAESWGCDASFVTVVTDDLESAGLAQRRVAPHDRRIKTVELTHAGVEARDWALGEVYGSRAGFAVLTAREQETLARLLTKVAAAQEAHDTTLVDQPDVRSTARRVAAQRTRQHRDGRGGGWREHLDVHREELRALKEELARMRDEFKAQARQSYDGAKADIKAEARRPVDEARAAVKAEAKAAKAAAKAAVQAEVAAAREELAAHRRGERKPR
jgi:hypothetical protein